MMSAHDHRSALALARHRRIELSEGFRRDKPHGRLLHVPRCSAKCDPDAIGPRLTPDISRISGMQSYGICPQRPFGDHSVWLMVASHPERQIDANAVCPLSGKAVSYNQFLFGIPDGRLGSGPAVKASRGRIRFTSVCRRFLSRCDSECRKCIH
jgi:hypothetical protein